MSVEMGRSKHVSATVLLDGCARIARWQEEFAYKLLRNIEPPGAIEIKTARRRLPVDKRCSHIVL